MTKEAATKLLAQLRRQIDASARQITDHNFKASAYVYLLKAVADKHSDQVAGVQDI